ncbi:hypothetical protein Tco_1252699 [Tanacetum coccineum]
MVVTHIIYRTSDYHTGLVIDVSSCGALRIIRGTAVRFRQFIRGLGERLHGLSGLGQLRGGFGGGLRLWGIVVVGVVMWGGGEDLLEWGCTLEVRVVLVWLVVLGWLYEFWIRHGGDFSCGIVWSIELGIDALALSDRHPTYHETPSDQVKMDDPNITMKEYIRLEEEKARRSGKVYNWETAMYGKIWYNEDVQELRYVETEFSAIVFNDAISFDESDDEDYTVIYDKNSFSYKIISVDDLKTDSENDNDIVNMPSFPSPEPMVSYFDDLDYFKDFEKEFPAIVYNDALTSKLDFLTEPTVSPQHINEFDDASLSEYDDEGQNVIYFNDLFPFNIVNPDDLSDKDNDNDKINIEHSSGDMSVIPLSNVINTDVGAYAHGYQYGVSWGMDMAYRLPIYFLGPCWKDINNVGGVFINLEISKC